MYWNRVSKSIGCFKLIILIAVNVLGNNVVNAQTTPQQGAASNTTSLYTLIENLELQVDNLKQIEEARKNINRDLKRVDDLCQRQYEQAKAKIKEDEEVYLKVCKQLIADELNGLLSTLMRAESRAVEVIVGGLIQAHSGGAFEKLLREKNYDQLHNELKRISVTVTYIEWRGR